MTEKINQAITQTAKLIGLPLLLVLSISFLIVLYVYFKNRRAKSIIGQAIKDNTHYINFKQN